MQPNNLEKVERTITRSRGVIRAAIGSYSKQMSASFRKLGIHRTPRYIRKQGEQPDTPSANFFESYCAWIFAYLDSGNEVGLEMVLSEQELFLRVARAYARSKRRAAGSAAGKITVSREDADRMFAQVKQTIGKLNELLGEEYVLKRAA